MKHRHTISELYKCMQDDLTCCHTDLERSMVDAIGGKEIRERAIEVARARKLTSREFEIARRFGYREHKDMQQIMQIEVEKHPDGVIYEAFFSHRRNFRAVGDSPESSISRLFCVSK